jgi:hypothetical protein
MCRFSSQILNKMQSLIEVFRMEEVRPKTRASIIIQLGRAINDQYAMNITEPLVYELVKQLDPDNDEIKDERYTRHLK